MSIQGDEGLDPKKKGPVTPGGMSEASFPVPEDDDDDDDNMMPMPDDDDDEENAGNNNLSFSRDSAGEAGGVAIGGLDDSADPPPAKQKTGDDDDEDSEDEAANKTKSKKRQQPVGPKRRRTRRKVVIDNDATELSGDQIRNNLADTSDIVLAHVPHPADWQGGVDAGRSLMSQYSHEGYTMESGLATQDDDNSTFVTGAGSTMYSMTQDNFYGDPAMLLNGDDETVATHRRPPPGLAMEEGQDDHLLLNFLSFEELLGRPSLGDDGQLAPELLKLWQDNLSRVRGKPFPYPKRSDPDQRKKKKNKPGEDSDDEEEDVEVARLDQDQDSKDGHDLETDGKGSKGQIPKEVGGEEMTEGEFPQPDDEDEDDGPMPMNDDDEEDDGPMPMNDDEEAPPMPFGDDDEDASSRGSDTEDKYGLSTWGMVNDARGDEEEDDEDDPRQASGTELVSSSSKWHKHTVRVLDMFQRLMGEKDGIKDAEGKDKPDHLTFGDISKKLTRRTAAGVFFEMLQLKTWDFVEVDQGEAYGDITVRPFVFFVFCEPLFLYSS